MLEGSTHPLLNDVHSSSSIFIEVVPANKVVEAFVQKEFYVAEADAILEHVSRTSDLHHNTNEGWHGVLMEDNQTNVFYYRLSI